MKRCKDCGKENSAEMNFCVECGTHLKREPQMVVPLETIESLNLTDGESFDLSRETFAGNRYQPSVPTISTPAPQSKTKILIVFGGLFVLFFLILAGAGTGLYFYWKSQKQVVVIPDKTPTPKRIVKNETPTPTSTPEPTPTTTPEDKSELKPTKQGSFAIDAAVAEWQLSDINTVPAETFRTGVSGTVVLAGIGEEIFAEGVSSHQERRVHKEFPTGALLMRTRYPNGKASNIQAVTDSDSWENSPDERGQLEFLINDNAPDDNEGEFTVTVTLVSVPN